MRQTLDQRRAKHAWDAIQRAKGGKNGKKYGGQAKKLPTRIMTAGLGQALAFLKAKGYAPELLQDVGHWVLEMRGNEGSKAARPPDDALITKIISSDSDFLRRVTQETLAYMQWLNRFAEAEGLTDEENS